MPAVRKKPTERIVCSDCLTYLASRAENSVDAVVTDPPYGIGIAGKEWDSIADFQQFCRTWGAECLRVLKPGGHLLAFGGSKTWHHLAVGLEASGFELRDTLMWLYGKGIPRGMSLDRQIDAHLGATRQVLGTIDTRSTFDGNQRRTAATNARTVAIAGTGRVHAVGQKQITKPATPEAAAWEGWHTNLKPGWEPILVLRKPLVGTVAANVLCHGVGGINVDGCGIPGDGASRFPSNLLIDDIVAAELDQSGGRRPPSRYFYCAKPTLEERQAGVDGENLHPCVKPVALMRWLVRLVTPPNGLVLDPFAGTGSTGVAALAEKRQFIGVEKDPEYARIASQRMA